MAERYGHLKVILIVRVSTLNGRIYQSYKMHNKKTNTKQNDDDLDDDDDDDAESA